MNYQIIKQYHQNHNIVHVTWNATFIVHLMYYTSNHLFCDEFFVGLSVNAIAFQLTVQSVKQLSLSV